MHYLDGCVSGTRAPTHPPACWRCSQSPAASCRSSQRPRQGSPARSGVVVRNTHDVKLLFNGHDKLDCVEAVQTELRRERRAWRDLCQLPCLASATHLLRVHLLERLDHILNARPDFLVREAVAARIAAGEHRCNGWNTHRHAQGWRREHGRSAHRARDHLQSSSQHGVRWVAVAYGRSGGPGARGIRVSAESKSAGRRPRRMWPRRSDHCR